MRVYFSAYLNKEGFSEILTATGKGKEYDEKIEKQEQTISDKLLASFNKRKAWDRKKFYFYESWFDYVSGEIKDISDERIVELV